MIVPLNPPLEGVAAERFLALAQSLAHIQQRNPDDLHHLLEEEIRWLKEQGGDSGAALAYEASARVLLDLVRLGWRVREAGYGIELIAEPPRLHGLSPEEILAEKQQTRRFFEATVQAQLNEPAVRTFVQRMENPAARTGKQPVTLLLADGPELHSRLLAARQASHLDDDPFSCAVSPYLQRVTADGIDPFTGHSLREIWRYLRYSWSIPQFSTPGRQLLYLVRDAAHPCHAVMGIIGLNNCALQMGEEREYYLGWNLRALTERLLTVAKESPERLSEEYGWLERQIAAALADIDPSQLAEPEELAHPGRETITKLRRRAQEFDRLRDETLGELAKIRSGNEGPLSVAEMECDYDHPPVSEDMLRLEEKPSGNPTMQKARRHLVARKRAALLAELLHARIVLREYREGLLTPS